MIKRVEREDGTRFQVYARAKGKKVYVGTYDSQRIAEAADEEHRVTRRKIASGELPAGVDFKRTTRQAVSEWLKSIAGKSRSYDIYEHRFRTHITPQLGDVSLARVALPMLVGWRDNLSHAVSAATVNSTIGTLSTFFKFCLSMHWIPVSPTRGLTRLEEPRHDFAWLKNGEQVTRLLAHCPPSIRAIFAVMVGTGLRIDEALHLRWDDVDLEHRLLHIHRGRQGTTKSGLARGVPIFDSVLPVLRELKLQRGGNVLVFPSPIGGRRLGFVRPERVRSKVGVSKPFKLAVLAAGLPGKLRPHDMRHSFAIQYLQDGGDLHRLSRILGHSTVITTERCYLRFKPTTFDMDYGRVRFTMPTGGEVVAWRQQGDAASSSSQPLEIARGK